MSDTCPSCGSSNTSAGPTTSDGETAKCEVECLDCGHFWVETYEIKEVIIH